LGKRVGLEEKKPTEKKTVNLSKPENDWRGGVIDDWAMKRNIERGEKYFTRARMKSQLTRSTRAYYLPYDKGTEVLQERNKRRRTVQWGTGCMGSLPISRIGKTL